MENENGEAGDAPVPNDQPPAIDPLGEAFQESMTVEERRAVARFDASPSLLSHVVAHVLARGSQLIMFLGNRVRLTGQERFVEARALDRGLLTFSNHVSLFDDPLVNACVLDAVSLSTLRWIAADALNFFGGPLRAKMFSAGKCVPVVRGAGPAQPGIRFLSDRLAAGEWIHVFPEGGRTRHPEGRLKTPLKQGMALLIKENRPLVLPFFHRGMHRILPIGARIPRLGKSVSIHVGTALDSALELADRSVEEITEWAEARLTELQDKAWSAPLD